MKKRNYIWTVLRKELMDTFRDKKTVFIGLLLPVLLYPILFSFMSRGLTDSQKEAETNTTIALLDAADRADVRTFLVDVIFKGDEGIKLSEASDPLQALADGTVKLVLRMDDTAADALVGNQQAAMTWYYNDTKANSLSSLHYVQALLQAYNNDMVDQKLRDEYNTSIDALQPLQLGTPEVYNANNAKGEADGGRGSEALSSMVPMLMLIVIAVGSMASAVDLFAGEKERKTLEPLLTTHAGRNSILTGKFLAVAIMGTLSSVLMLGGFGLGMATNPALMGAESGSAALNLPLPALALCLLLILAAQLSFSAIHVMLSAYAKNIKEASTYGTLVMLGAMIPAYATMFMQSGDVPQWMMYVPIVNVVGAMKMLLGGLINYTMVGISLAISALFLGILLTLTARMFHKESIMLRS